MKKTKVVFVVSMFLVLALVTIISLSSLFSGNRQKGVVSRGSFDASGEALVSSAGLSSPMMPINRGKMAVPSGSSLEDSSGTVFFEETDKKVIKNGNLTLKVNKIDKALVEIEKVAEDNGGDLFSSDFSQNSQNLKSGTLSIKVPITSFEKTFGEIKKIAAVVLHESTSGQDVTEQYQDLESQIRNKNVEEEAYQKILNQAQKISDIIEVTQALSRVRGEIESLQGRLRYLASQTDMSTIMINMSEDSNITISDSWRPLQVAKEAIRMLVVKVQNFVDFLIIFVITFIPVIFLYLVLFWIIYKIGRAIFKKVSKIKEEKTD